MKGLNIHIACDCTSPHQGITQDLETGGQNWGFLKFRGSKVSYPIYKNDHSNLIYWFSKTKCASLCNLMYLLSSRSETFEIFPWTQTNTENLAKYNWVSFSQKSCVWESKWLPGGCLGKSLDSPLTWLPLVLRQTWTYVCVTDCKMSAVQKLAELPNAPTRLRKWNQVWCRLHLIRPTPATGPTLIEWF